MQVRLTRKLAECLDGIDVSRFREGDIVDLTPHDAALLIAEGWAAPYAPPVGGPSRALDGDGNAPGRPHEPASPPDREAPRRAARTLDQLRKAREELEQQRLGEQEHRRMEDEIREHLRDSRARTVDQKDKE
jgi:hypothetical protein